MGRVWASLEAQVSATSKGRASPQLLGQGPWLRALCQEGTAAGGAPSVSHSACKGNRACLPPPPMATEFQCREGRGHTGPACLATLATGHQEQSLAHPLWRSRLCTWSGWDWMQEPGAAREVVVGLLGPVLGPRAAVASGEAPPVSHSCDMEAGKGRRVGRDRELRHPLGRACQPGFPGVECLGPWEGTAVGQKDRGSGQMQGRAP